MSNPDSTTGAKRARRTRRRTTGAAPEPEAAPVRGRSKKGEEPASFVAASTAHPRGGGIAIDRVRARDVTQFLRQLIMLLDAGTPLLRTLKTLAERASRASLRRMVQDIADYVESGNTFWQALSRHPRVFSDVEINLIKAAEAGGMLVTILEQLVIYRERRAILMKKVRGALMYPVVLLVACLAVALVIAKVVVPEFKDLFERMDIEISGFSRTIIDSVTFFGNWWYLFVAAPIVLVMLYAFWARSTPGNRYRADWLVLRIPIIGRILKKYATVQLTRTLSLLLKSGLPMLTCLDLTRRAVGNQAVGRILQEVRTNVESGGGIEEPFRRYPRLVDPVVTDMLVTGEESGQLDKIAEQIAVVYEEEVNIEVNTLGESFQPVLVVIIGAMVGTLFIALFMPMIQLLEQLNAAQG